MYIKVQIVDICDSSFFHNFGWAVKFKVASMNLAASELDTLDMEACIPAHLRVFFMCFTRANSGERRSIHYSSIEILDISWTGPHQGKGRKAIAPTHRLLSIVWGSFWSSGRLSSNARQWYAKTRGVLLVPRRVRIRDEGKLDWKKHRHRRCCFGSSRWQHEETYDQWKWTGHQINISKPSLTHLQNRTESAQLPKFSGDFHNISFKRDFTYLVEE